MREIKFRAWDKVIGKFHYSRDYPSMWQFFRALEDIGIRHFETHQYTGLKDKNGKEIYERDIVNLRSTYETDEPINYNTEVLFRDGRFTTDFHDLQVCGFTRKGMWEGEVIGNIYENPELLDKE